MAGQLQSTISHYTFARWATIWIRMRCKLGLNLRCCTECRIIQHIQILLHRAGRIVWINGVAIPIFLWRRVLFVRVRPQIDAPDQFIFGLTLNQTGVCRKALAAHQTISDTPGDSLFKKMPQQRAFPKAPMSHPAGDACIAERAGSWKM